MSRENFDNNIRDIIASYRINTGKNLSETARDLDISRQTVRRLENGETRTVKQNTLDKIAEGFDKLDPRIRAKTYYGAEVVQDKIFETGNRKEALKDIRENRTEFNKLRKEKEKEWKESTPEQKSHRGYSEGY